MCSREGSCQLLGKGWKEDAERMKPERWPSLMRGETAGGLVFMDWRRWYLHHGNSKNVWNWTEILHGCLQLAASIAVQTDYKKHLRLTVSTIFHTVCTSSTGVVFY